MLKNNFDGINDDDMHRIMKMRSKIEQMLFRDFSRKYDKPKGIKFSHIITMVIVHYNPNRSMSELSLQLNMEKGSVTSVVDKLIKLDYITSVRSEKDRRVYHLNLTDKGEAIAIDFTKKHEKHIANLMDQLDDDSKEKFFKATEVITEILEQFES